MNLFKRTAKSIAMAVAAVCLLSLSACGAGGHEFAPTQNSIYVATDHKIMSAEFADFDNSEYDTPRYDQTEFQTYAQETVSDYNKEKSNLAYYDTETAQADLPVSIESLTFEGTKVTLILKFQDFSTYSDFYGSTDAVPVKNLVVGSVSDGTSSGLDYADMVDAEGNTADPAVIKDNSSYNLIMLTGKTEIQCEGTVAYYSKTMTLKDEYTVESSGQTVEFIIFK